MMGEKLQSYNKYDPKSIETYAKGLINKTFSEVIKEDQKSIYLISGDNSSVVSEDRYDMHIAGKEDKKNKGNLGQIIEERYFHYKCNSNSRPDFHEAGVELKVTPYKQNRDESISAKERLVLTMIDYEQVINEQFETGHFWTKSKLLLLIYYLYKPEIKQRIDYKIGFVSLFTPSKRDLVIIHQDYDIIVDKIKAGKAHELSEADTMYLSAAPKASSSKVRRRQPFSDIPAKPRAFAYKSSYMTFVLNNYIVPGKGTYESIETDSDKPFEQYVAEKINRYKGRSVEELASTFDLSKKQKNLESNIAFRILGITGNKAEEFAKANIVVKAIRIGKNGKIKENMSFPTFKFKELIKEDWDDSTFGNYLRETRFFFVVYKYDDMDVLRLKGCQFWNIPYDDLENGVRPVWEKTVSILKNGLEFEIRDGKHYNNFPKQTESYICHVRPHAQNSKDTYELPDGRQFPKQCFWLNNTYILSQLNDELK